MMEPILRVDGSKTNPMEGRIKAVPFKMCWNLGMLSLAIFLAPLTYSFEAFLVFLVTTYFSLLIGHSVGMHRMMIHRSLSASKRVERVLIYVGVLVGMAGPFGVIKIHDLRDWAQRQNKCHDFFSHRRNFFLDILWQLTCQFEFKNSPKISIEDKYAKDKFLIFLEKTWPLHQILPGVVLYYFGGWSFVVWGVFVRVSVSVIGHWTITYFCHNPGPGKWIVEDASVQASNIPGLGVITYGECWHNNHHAFPESAKIGLEKGQSDPSWKFIQLLDYMGLLTSVRLPRPEHMRDDLVPRH